MHNHNHNHNHKNIITLRNYASQYIYNHISIKYPNLEPQAKQLKLQSIFKELINNIRDITLTNEIDHYNIPMSFLFQHIRPTIIQLIANCSIYNDKLFIEKTLYYNIDWCIRVFNVLQSLGSRDIIVWLFFHIPYYNESEIQIDKQRTIYITMLEWMIDNWKLEHYFTENEFIYLSNQTCMPYAASYHNRNNKLLLETYCKLLRKICPWLNYYSSSLAETILKHKLKDKYKNILGTPNTSASRTTNPIIHTPGTTARTKIKVCFISDSFTTDTSVLRDRISIIGKLDRTQYDVYFASFCPFESINSDFSIAKIFMTRIKDNYIYLGNTLSSARTILEPYKFDIIVYPDIGMKLMPTLLAYSRIAAVQITTWGHSETSGIDTIDYFISSAIFEKDISISQQYYSEKLILFKSLGTYYISPHKLFVNKDYIFKTRDTYGFTKNQHIYVCLQTYYKINHEFEKCLARILELDPDGIILLSNTFPYCKSHLIRIRNTIGIEKLKRVKWFGSLEKCEFLNLISISDVCLDPFPFGGFNTSYDAFDYNIPVITMEGEYLHGRFTSGLYRKMGLDECILRTPEEYIQLATQIGINDKLRHKINRNIEINKKNIFQDDSSCHEWSCILAECMLD